MHEAVVVERAARGEDARNNRVECDFDARRRTRLRIEGYVVAFAIPGGDDVEANGVAGRDLNQIGAEGAAQREDVDGFVRCSRWSRHAIGPTARHGEEE